MNTRSPYGSPPPSGSPSPEPSPRERVARLRSLARRAFGYWKMAALILLAGCGIALFVAMRTKLIYRSECVILFKPAMKTSDRQEDESPGERAAKLAPKLKEVLTTRSRLELMIKEYSLYPKTVDSKGMLEAVDEMRSHVGFRGRDSETFIISFENEGPELAQKVTQRMADTMIDEFTKSNVGTAKQQADFLMAQESRSEQELQNANKALAIFLTLHPEFAVEAKGGSAFGPTQAPGAAGMQQQMPMMMPSLPKDPAAMGDPQLGVLYRQKARLEAEMRNNAGGAPSAAGPVNAGQVGQLTTARDEAAKVAAAAQAELAEKRIKLTDAHPDVIAAKLAAENAARQLHQAEVQLAAAKAAASGAAIDPQIVAGTNPELEKRLAAIDAQIASRKAAVQRQKAAQAEPSAAPGDAAAAVVAVAAPVTNELVELETEWQRLLRVLHDVKIEHDDLKQRLERAKLSASAVEASGGDQMQILDPAYKPMRPAQGGRTKTALLGGVMALLLALGYAFSRVFFNDTLIDQADVEALQLIPVLGVLPKVRAAAPSARAPRSKAAKEARGAV
jgi:uncharacterized protein involved in exopolysaccharide biosynthesis